MTAHSLTKLFSPFFLFNREAYPPPPSFRYLVAEPEEINVVAFVGGELREVVVRE